MAKKSKPKYDTSFNFGFNVKPKGKGRKGGSRGGKPKGGGS
jgi:hypothetical protein